MQQAQARGNAWLQTNYMIPMDKRKDVPDWTNYYMYALERYFSFREAAEGNQEKEPRWYNDGVRYLMKTQAEDGSWTAG